jgi:hypothetical protein
MRIQAAGWSCLVAIGVGLTTSSVLAKVPAEQAAQLDTDKLTCLGAERAGSPTGVAPYTGKWLGAWPGIKNEHGYDPGPFADEKPLFTITAENMDQYADKLTEGEKGLLKKYPKTYRMPVYPSHRDFRFADWVCDVTKKNATTAEVVHDGLGIDATLGGVIFPFPQSGLEAIFNVIKVPRAWNESSVEDVADVYPSGSITWGKVVFRTMNPGGNPNANPHPNSQKEIVDGYFYHGQLLPERDKGSIAVGFQPNDFKLNKFTTWQYNPGLRRVRQAPDIGFDYPVPPAGLRTVDDDYLFNGSPERYTWKLVGKKEIYVPYDNFKINDPALKYSELIKPGTINPDYERYELHRVWIIEGNLKSGLRHIYSKRVIYADEDSWLAIWADNYDARGQLWRANFVNYFYSPESDTFHRSTTLYHDLSAGTYEAGYMVNDPSPGNWWKLNDPTMSASMYSPDALARAGH